MAKKQIKKENKRRKERRRVEKKEKIEEKVERKEKTEYRNIFHPLVREGLPIWAKIITWIIVILAIVLMAFGNIIDIIIEIIGLLIFLYCGKKCFELASEIKKSTAWAYIIGIFFGLLGLLAYWSYYKMIKAKVKKWKMIISLIIIYMVLLLIYIALLFISSSAA